MGSFILRTPFNRSVSLARRARRYQSILFARRQTGKAKTTRCLQRSEWSLQTKSRCSNLHAMATLGPKNGRTFSLCTNYNTQVSVTQHQTWVFLLDFSTSSNPDGKPSPFRLGGSDLPRI